MAREEEELMLISSTLVEMMPHDTMIGPLAGMYYKVSQLAMILFFLQKLLKMCLSCIIVKGIEEKGENAAESVTEIKIGSAEGHDLGSVADVHALASERGTLERGMLEMRAVETPVVERENEIVGLQQEKTAGVGKEVERERKGAEARIARGKGREAREQREKRWLREMAHWKVVSGYWRNVKENLVREWRSVETGNEIATETAGAATGIEIAAGGTGIGTTNESVTETGVIAKRSTTAPYKMTWVPKKIWATTTKQGHRHMWKSTVRMG